MQARMCQITMRVAVLLLCGMLLGCSATPTPTPLPPSRPSVAPAPTPTLSGRAYAIVPVKAQGFAEIKPEEVTVKPQVPAYKTDPRAALNAELANQLTPVQLKRLEQDGFVVAVRGRPLQIYEIYTQAKRAGTPQFVTTDALLHTYHVLYDLLLRQAEYDHLAGDLGALLKAMMETSEAQVNEAKGFAPVQEAARRNLAFFNIAARLLDPEVPVRDSVHDLVTRELKLIEAHAGFAASPLFGYREDYSQYVPRGHYTRNETFERYFRAMMWLGRIMFRLRPGRSTEEIAAGRRETRQAMLIVVALHSAQIGDKKGLQVWERIYEPTTFFVGQTDDLNVYDYSEAMRQAFGASLGLAALADDAQVDAFIAAASALRPPKIVSSYVTDQEDPALATKGFRFMGQRFVPDAYIFQQLVYNKVLTYQGQGAPFTKVTSAVGPIRGFPRGLDIAAVLGSERALEILRTEGDTAYAGYDAQMVKLRQEFAALSVAQWNENLYWSWLHTLRPMLTPKGEGYPAFMRSPAWRDKGLNTFLGSWSELRHDTILYAKQSYSIMATSMRPPTQKPSGYVEPDVEVWDRLLRLVRRTQAGLKGRGLLSQELGERLSRMEQLVLQLRDIAAAELANQPLTERQTELIEGIGSTLSDITTLSEQTKDKIASTADERMAIVADVHTDSNSRQVLEEAVGDPWTLYVLVPNAQGTVIALGGVFSYYEFKQPMDQRLTDEAWQRMAPRPTLAPWLDGLVEE